ncbi:helix-turn-helix domain-containing protein [Nocardia sp. NBC_00511]|uniref:helix-turn-helix domain-containing protein n=1 Tax=Nocardia sp. NBC_00511 TaxID=2903591 RepID=UPI0030E156E1
MPDPFAPVIVTQQFWGRDEVLQALGERDVGTLLRQVQRDTGASQQRLATMLGISQGRVNELVNRRRTVTSLSSFERIAECLKMPDSARITLGIAPTIIPPAAALGPTEISATYLSQEAAAAEIRDLTTKAKHVDVLAVRGLGILGLNGSLLREVLAPDAQLRVLLLAPDSDAARARAEEIGESAESFSVGIRLSVARIKELTQTSRMAEVYVYAESPVWRIIRLDDVLFVSAFTVYREGHSSSVHRIEPNQRGILHHAFVRMLEQAFTNAVRIV